MGEIHSDGVDKGGGASDSMTGNDLKSMMVTMMTDLKSELKESQVRMEVNQNARYEYLKEIKGSKASIREKVTILKEVQTPRHLTPKKDYIHRKASGVERVVARGDGGYGEYMGKRYEMNGEGGYKDYKCYGGYSRGSLDRGDESRYYGDGLDRRGMRERVTKLQKEHCLILRGEYEPHKGYERPIERDALSKAWRGSNS